jgi:hypothetical protein
LAAQEDQVHWAVPLVAQVPVVPVFQAGLL